MVLEYILSRKMTNYMVNDALVNLRQTEEDTHKGK